jgi:hypothetical protein
MTDRPNVFPTSAETVNFHNGMIVTAEDLHTAMTYPIQLMQIVNRSVHGCGVVCGFHFAPDPKLCDRPPDACDPCKDVDPDTNPLVHANSILEIGCGTAMDCSGMPIELCQPQRIELSPETCGCDGDNSEMCILIRRVPAFEAPRGDCCAPGEGAVVCSRKRDHVEIRAFPSDELPDHTCKRDFPDGANGDCVPISSNRGQQARAEEPHGRNGDGEDQKYEKLVRRLSRACGCMVDCGDCCGCCGDGWVLLGCVELCNGKIVARSLDPEFDLPAEKKQGTNPSDPASPYFRRKWIKSIECLCGPDKDEMVRHEAQAEAQTHKALALKDALEEREIAVQMEKDDQVYETIEKLGDLTRSQLALLRTYRFRNLEHAGYVLNEIQPELSKQMPFSKEKDQERLAQIVEALQRRKG